MTFVVTLCLLGSSVPAVAAKKPPPEKKTAVAQAASVPSAVDIAKFVGEKALGAAAGKAFGFVFSALGLDGGSPDAAALRAIQVQLENISQQLVTVQKSIDTLNTNVLQNGLDAQLIGLRTQANAVKDFYDTKFLPVLNDAIALADAKAKNDTTAIDQAKSKLFIDRLSFDLTFDFSGLGGIPQNFHDALVPGAATSVLSAMGKVLLSQRRYLTSDVSTAIRTLYRALADQEALAAWMRLERAVPADPTPPHAFDTFELVRKQYLANVVEEYRYLPPMIPAGVVIDAGPVATLRTSTSNVTMWRPASDLGDVRSRPGGAAAPTIEGALGTLNAQYRGNFNDWKVPSQSAETSGLLGDFNPKVSKSANDYLSALDPNSPVWQVIATTPWRFMWSSDTVTQSVRCSGLVAGRTVFQTVTFPSNTAVSTSTATPVWAPRPKLDTERQTRSSDPAGACRTYGESMFAGADASARVMVMRSTGTMPMDYTATGLDFNIVPSANLRGADLTDFNLAGADLSGVNLTNATLNGAALNGANLAGANLTGANLTGADLTGADLTNATLTNATLNEVTLTKAVVTGAKFSTDNDNKFAGIVSGGLIGAPATFSASGRFRITEGYFVGPNTNMEGAAFTSSAQLGISLSAANLTRASLEGVNLAGAFLNNAILTDAHLTGANLSGVNLSAATLRGVVSGAIIGNPALPPDWRLVNGYLVGPGASLASANLSGTNLTGIDFMRSALTDADLSGANLTATNLTDAALTGADVTDAVWSNTTCPSGAVQSTPCAVVSFDSPSSVRATTSVNADTLLVDIGPNLSNGDWLFTVEQRTQSGGFVAVGSFATHGSNETAIINLHAGTYHVVVPQQHAHVQSVSAAVALVK
jgi:uncharacterized protein YjbI with pentapeptide repeats